MKVFANPDLDSRFIGERRFHFNDECSTSQHIDVDKV